jgi:hypothetical protein
MTENVLYFGRTFVQEGPIGLGLLFYLRVILGGFGHAIYTGTTGAGIGIARESRSFLGVLVAVIFFALAIAQHAAWNTIAATFIPGLVDDSAGGVLALLFVIFPITAVVFQAPGFIGLLALATWSSRREARIIMEHLRPELADGVITEAEYRVIGRGLVRSMTEFGTLVSRGPGAWLRQRQLHQLATELAFSRYHRARGEFADTAPATEQSYRDRIRALRPA